MPSVTPYPELTVYKVAVDFKTQKPVVCSELVFDKGGNCYWAKNRITGRAFGCNQRLSKFECFTSPAVAVKHFASIERAKAIDLRRQADEMDAMAAAAEALPL